MIHPENLCRRGSSPNGLPLLLLVACLGSPLPSPAGETPGGSADDQRAVIPVDRIALELSNPVSAIRSLSWDVEYLTYQGDLPEAGDQSAIRNLITTSWPIQFDNGNNLTMQLTIPIYGDQPYWKPISYLDWAEYVIRQLPEIDETVGGFESGHDHMGDIGFDIGYGGVSDSGVIGMLGISAVLPTSEDQSARRGQYLLGPEATLGQVTSWGLYGATIKHLTDVEGQGVQEVGYLPTNETTLDLFFAWALGNGWQIESNPTILYDWEAVDGNKWTVPIGGGASRTLRLGRVPMKLALEVEYFVVSPDRFGPEWLFSFSFVPVLSTRLLD